MSERLNDKSETTNAPEAWNDFFRHVNQEWLDTTPIPSTEARWGSFDIARHRTAERLRDIAENLQHEHDLSKGSPEQQVRDFYASVLDMEARNAAGVSPLDELRTTINETTNGHDAVKAVAELRLSGVRAFFGLWFGEDDKKAGNNALYVSQGGLGLPNREYYLNDDAKSEEVREKYKQYMTNVFQKLGRSEDEAVEAASAVYAIEHEIAEIHRPSAEVRDVEKNYHKYTLDEAKASFPEIDWEAYFTTLGKSDIKDFVIKQPEVIKRVGELLQTSDIAAIKDYMEFRLLDSYAGTLSEEFEAESFKFNGQTLQGLKEPKPRWKQAISIMDTSLLNHAIAPMYCREHFNEQDKLQSMAMVADITEAFRERVENLDWMTDQTKALTLKKLDNIVFKMGFPDNWLDISGIDIRPDSFATNRMNISRFNIKRELARLEEPFDHTEWLMPPTEVNACSDLKREMTFPAAILQPPFYDPERDDAYNYGAIGGVIGHELTHFFDDKGCMFDLNGNVNDWWSDEDRERFEKKTRKFVEYFGSLTADGLQINGELTLGENIADVGGITVAYYALQKKLERDDGHKIVDGLTPEQRLFTGWAKVWAKKVTPELAKQYILIDPHSPAEVRVNGVLSIVPEFHDAFKVTPGDGMHVDAENLPTLW